MSAAPKCCCGRTDGLCRTSPALVRSQAAEIPYPPANRIPLRKEAEWTRLQSSLVREAAARAPRRRKAALPKPEAVLRQFSAGHPGEHGTHSPRSPDYVIGHVGTSPRSRGAAAG